MIVGFGVVLIVLLVGVLLLIPLGFREGDKPGDALVLGAVPHPCPRGVSVEVTNRGHVPLLIGMSLRRPGLRLRLEGGAYARLRTRGTTPDLLPERQAFIGVLHPGEREMFVVVASANVGRRAELVVVCGQPDRLRSIHRSVSLTPLEPGYPARPAEPAVQT